MYAERPAQEPARRLIKVEYMLTSLRNGDTVFYIVQPLLNKTQAFTEI